MPDDQAPDSISGPGDPASGLHAAKIAQRDQLLTARGRRSLTDVGQTAREMADHIMATPEVRYAATVAAYVSIGTEPGTSALLSALGAAGKRVILPCVMPGNDLDWAVYTGDRGLMPARFGLLEPAAARLGPDAIATADAVLVPGLAVDDAGRRLGRGGGCYDRALGRVPTGTFTCVLLYPEEAGVPVPVEAHDRPVTASATARGIVRYRSSF